MTGWLPDSFGSVVALLGAVTVGWVFHGVLRGDLAAWSPGAVGGLVVGGLLLLAGSRLKGRFEPERFVTGRTGGDDEEYDPRFSPLDESPSEDADDDSRPR
jgi:hypothetical protein